MSANEHRVESWADLRHHSRAQGGSSITQQYVKNVYVGRQRTFMRKIKEAIIAIKLERKYSKRQILERYLNTIYFGRGAYGVEAAAKTWFGKDVGQLGLPEASYLAGLIRGPETADVGRNRSAIPSTSTAWPFTAAATGVLPEDASSAVAVRTPLTSIPASAKAT